MSRQHNPELSAYIQRASTARGLTVNAAHQRLGISREALTKLTLGIPIELETLERVAMGLGVDAIQLRGLAGYSPIPGGENPRDRFWRLFGEAHERCRAEGVYLPAPTGDEDHPGWDTMSDADMERLIATLEQLARARHLSRGPLVRDEGAA